MPASHQDELIISVARNHRQVFRTNQEAYVGREGNVRIGADDANLHRVMFVIWHNGSTWMIGNKSSYLPLTITPNLQHSHAVTTMGPKSVTSLPPGESRITFSTQTRSYTVMVLICMETFHLILSRFSRRSINFTLSAPSSEEIQRVVEQIKAAGMQVDTFEYQKRNCSASVACTAMLEVKIKRGKRAIDVFDFLSQFDTITIEHLI